MKKSKQNQPNPGPTSSPQLYAPTVLLAAVTFCAACALRASDQEPPTNLVQLALSDFNSGTDGWMQGGDKLTAVQPTYLPNGGSAGGGIASDSSKDFFLAPAMFRGDQHKAYGGKLRFDLRLNKFSSKSSKLGDLPMVRLQFSGLVLANFMPQNPPLSWTTFAFTLTETHGWVNLDSGRPATRGEMRA